MQLQPEDIRNSTLARRLQIGFDGVRPNWSQAPAIFTNDTLQIQGHPVMERWEDGYMKQLAQIATSQGGAVLEVGFGMGISAGYIQQFPIERHLIIEANAEVAARARAFAAGRALATEVLEGFWEDRAVTIPSGSLSGILFDTYPLSAEQVHCNHFNFFETAFRLLKHGGVLTYYSDEISEFSAQHRERLLAAGFSQIDGLICPVSPPADCQYWKSQTFSHQLSSDRGDERVLSTTKLGGVTPWTHCKIPMGRICLLMPVRRTRRRWVMWD